jgi:hypothetical protein
VQPGEKIRQAFQIDQVESFSFQPVPVRRVFPQGEKQFPFRAVAHDPAAQVLGVVVRLAVAVRKEPAADETATDKGQVGK